MNTQRKVGIAALVLVALALITPATGQAPAAPASKTQTPVVKAQPTATTAAPAVDLAAFERANAIAFPEVTGREIKLGALWVYTNLAPGSTSRAASICGAYAQVVLVDPTVRVTFVRAIDGLQLAKCGPGA